MATRTELMYKLYSNFPSDQTPYPSPPPLPPRVPIIPSDDYDDIPDDEEVDLNQFCVGVAEMEDDEPKGIVEDLAIGAVKTAGVAAAVAIGLSLYFFWPSFNRN